MHSRLGGELDLQDLLFVRLLSPLSFDQSCHSALSMAWVDWCEKSSHESIVADALQSYYLLLLFSS